MGLRCVGQTFGGTLLLAAVGLAAPLAAAGSHDVSMQRLPLRFEPNRGQSDPEVLFLARGRGYGLFLTAQESVIVLPRAEAASSEAAVLRLKLQGAEPEPEAVGLDELPGRSHYLRGRDPSAWTTDVPQYARVELRGVYPGIDLAYYGKEGQVEYDFVVAPGADPGDIRFRIEGARDMRVDDDGHLVFSFAGGEVIHRAPVVYQEREGERRSVSGRYARHGCCEVGFEIGTYDRARPLVIDPVLAYSTYLGGSSSDLGVGVGVDSSGNVYVTGITFINFPIANPLQASPAGGYEVFVSKLNASGSALVYSTYLGGGGNDRGLDLVVDSTGSALVTGDTTSTDFPTANPLQSSHAGGTYDAFLAKLNPAGSALVYSTYLGGSGFDGAEFIAVDPSGNAYVTGWTTSMDFPTVNAVQASSGGGAYDAFVAKLDASGSAHYSTYLGGEHQDWGDGIAADPSGNAYVTGFTWSTSFPTVNPLQPSKGGGNDAFVTKLNPSGSAFVYSTYLGGGTDDYGRGIAADPSGNAYVTGYTYSPDFPTADPLQPSLAGQDDAFVSKLSPSGSALTYSTFLGGSSYDSSEDITVDTSGNVYVTGSTQSTNFPTANPLQPSIAGNEDGFVAKLDASGSMLAYSTYLGGSANDRGSAIEADLSGSAYISGYTASTDFPTASPLQAANGGGEDAIIVKISPSSTSYYTLTPCRLLDTRDLPGTYGGPALVAGAARVFPLASRCAIAPAARAVSVNLTVTQPTAAGNLRLYPAGAPLPSTSSLNYVAGQTRANNAVVPLNGLGELAAYCSQASGTAHLVLDVNGYFE